MSDVTVVRGPSDAPRTGPVPGPNEPVLVAERVEKEYRTRTGVVRALAEVSLSTTRRSFTSLIGPSGCGKSTLLRMFADLTGPSQGAVTINGETPRRAREARAFSMVFQQPNLMPWRSVRRNITLPLELMRMPKDTQWARCQEMLDMLGLADFANNTPAELSGGMQQRVAIGRALVVQPSILFMDEPFGALDEITRERMNQELMRLCDRLQVTVLFVTHSISEAVFLSTDVIVMSARPGRVVGRVGIGFDYPRSPDVRRDPRFFEYETAIRDLLQLGSGPTP